MSDLMPDFQIATIAAAAGVLMDEFDIDQDEAIRVAALIGQAEKDALAEFGPELTLLAAETLWEGDTG